VAAIRRRIADLTAQVTQLTAEVAQLREQNETLTEAARQRSAAKATPGPKRN
jgi:cell division protein FtsB